MSDVFGRPKEVKDVMATLTAIASLVEHYSATFQTENGDSSSTAVWHSMVRVIRLFYNLTHADLYFSFNGLAKYRITSAT
jgi:hypothetical protein